MAEQDIKAIIDELSKSAKELGLDAKGLTEILTVVKKIEELSKIEINQEGGAQSQQNANHGFQLVGNILFVNGNELNGKKPEEILNEFTQVIINALKEHFTSILPELKIEINYTKINEFLEKELYPKIKNYIYRRSNDIIQKINGEQAKQHKKTRDHVTRKIRDLLNKIPSAIDLGPLIKRLDTILRNTGRLLLEQKKGIDLITRELQIAQNSIHNLTQQTRAEFSRISSQLDRIEADVDTANRGIIEILNRLDNTAKRHDIEELDRLINELFEILQRRQEIEINMIQRIQDSLDDYVLPSIDALYRQGHQNYALLTQIAYRTRSIEQKLQDIATRQDVQNLDQNMRTRFNTIDQQLQRILEMLGQGRGREDPGGGDETVPDGAQFELVWVMARNQAAAQHLEQTNDLPGYPNHSNDYIILNYFLNPHQLHVHLNQESLSQLIHNHIPHLAREMSNRGFQLNEVYLRLGARIIGTQRPWRWDV